MAKKKLTARFVESRKTAGDFPDALVPGLALRVTPGGHKSFVLIGRFPPSRNPTRRALGAGLTLGEARERARGWLKLIERGIDPAVEEARERALHDRRQANTFGAVAEAFLERHASRLRTAAEIRRTIETEFVERWGDRPVTEIAPAEVALAIRAIAKRGPYVAHNSFAALRRLFRWAVNAHEFGLLVSPMAQMSPRDLIGAREVRSRTLSDAELAAVWVASDDLKFPFGPLVKLLILTGQRRDEIADLQWKEIDFDRRLLTIPASRMKNAAPHEVPLAPTAQALLETLPRFKGPFCFTTTAGKRPVSGFSKAKARLDRLSGVTDWRLHDLRRTMRTRISALPVEDVVRELVIAHARPGMHKVYDQHRYRDEKARCLDLWATRLLAIVNPPPEAITDLSQAREARRAVV